MVGTADWGLRLAGWKRLAVAMALLGSSSLPALAQDRVARPGAAETAVLTYPFVVKVQLSERRLTPTGMVTSTRSYSEALVGASNATRPSEVYCALARVGSRGEWSCGAVRTGSTVVVSVRAGNLVHSCQARVPEVVAAPRVVLAVTVHGATASAPTACAW